MAKGPSYNVPFRRRRQGKTDYQLRRGLVASGLPRLVARKTLKYVITQIVMAKANGDEILTSAHSSELSKKYGWLGGENNIPAAYLTGLLCGYRASAIGVSKAVLDIGLQSPTKGSRVFSVLKGVLDAGIEVPHGEEVLPPEGAVEGKHISEYASKISSSEDEHSQVFSRYVTRGIEPEKISENFLEVKKRIDSEFKKAPKKRTRKSSE